MSAGSHAMTVTWGDPQMRLLGWHPQGVAVPGFLCLNSQALYEAGGGGGAGARVVVQNP